jgi:hypothetical protein
MRSRAANSEQAMGSCTRMAPAATEQQEEAADALPKSLPHKQTCSLCRGSFVDSPALGQHHRDTLLLFSECVSLFLISR